MTLIPTHQHPHSVAAAKQVRADGIPKARADRRAIADYIAKQGANGATDEELARQLPGINPNALRARRGEAAEFAVISAMAGERRKTLAGNTATVWHVTKRGLVALGLEPAEHWHVDQGAK